jgi:hypothetical protein
MDVYLATVQWCDETVIVGVFASFADADAAFGVGGDWRSFDEDSWDRRSDRPVEDFQCIDRITVGDALNGYAPA